MFVIPSHRNLTCCKPQELPESHAKVIINNSIIYIVLQVSSWLKDYMCPSKWFNDQQMNKIPFVIEPSSP